ncbi:MAG: HD domain-containing protein [bacterium]
MKQGMWIEEIASGRRVKGLFLAKEKKALKGKTGKEYLLVRLADRTGEVEARVWDRVEQLGARFKAGDLVHISGDVSTYQGVIQVRILELEKHGSLQPQHLEEFVPGYADQRQRCAKMFSELEELLDTVEAGPLKALALDFLRDPELREGWLLTPAAKRLHHARLGGLLEHTLSLCRMICLVSKHYPMLRKDLLLAGGVIHDVGKIRELQAPWRPDYTTEGRLLGHIVMGLQMLDERLVRHPEISLEEALLLRHMIASHHGQLEFGSPKRPKTLEALVLYMLDDLDAKVDAFQEHLRKEHLEEDGWTSYHAMFERYLYRGAEKGVEEDNHEPHEQSPP